MRNYVLKKNPRGLDLPEDFPAGPFENYNTAKDMVKYFKQLSDYVCTFMLSILSSYFSDFILDHKPKELVLTSDVAFRTSFDKNSKIFARA